jgi:hypothetical protein
MVGGIMLEQVVPSPILIPPFGYQDLDNRLLSPALLPFQTFVYE